MLLDVCIFLLLENKTRHHVTFWKQNLFDMVPLTFLEMWQHHCVSLLVTYVWLYYIYAFGLSTGLCCLYLKGSTKHNSTQMYTTNSHLNFSEFIISHKNNSHLITLFHTPHMSWLKWPVTMATGLPWFTNNWLFYSTIDNYWAERLCFFSWWF